MIFTYLLIMNIIKKLIQGKTTISQQNDDICSLFDFTFLKNIFNVIIKWSSSIIITIGIITSFKCILLSLSSVIMPVILVYVLLTER